MNSHITSTTHLLLAGWEMKQFKPIGSHWNGGQNLINVLHTMEPHFIFISRGPWAAACPCSPSVSLALQPAPGCSADARGGKKQLFGMKGEALDWNFFDLQEKIQRKTQLVFSYNADMKISLRNPMLGWNMRWENKCSPFTCLMFHIILEVFHCLILMFSDYFHICLEAILSSNGPSS